MIDDNADFKLINEAFPHLGKKLRFFWGYPEFGPLVDTLLLDARGGNRAGFPANVLAALFNLSEAHDLAHPTARAKPTDIWSR